MIDARDDMWQEEKYANYRQANKIYDDRVVPAKDKLRFFLTEIVKLQEKKVVD